MNCHSTVRLGKLEWSRKRRSVFVQNAGSVKIPHNNNFNSRKRGIVQDNLEVRAVQWIRINKSEFARPGKNRMSDLTVFGIFGAVMNSPPVQIDVAVGLHDLGSATAPEFKTCIREHAFDSAKWQISQGILQKQRLYGWPATTDWTWDETVNSRLFFQTEGMHILLWISNFLIFVPN